MKIDLCIATFRRPMLADTLASVQAAQIPTHVHLRIIVVDNDFEPTAQEIVQKAKASGALSVTYVHAPAANISLARNAGLDASDADWVAFIDDDEIVDQDWLMHMVAGVEQTGADAVFGPSVPLYPESAPNWIKEGDFHRQEVQFRAGRVVTGHTCNAMLRWQGTPWMADRFDLSLGRTGGEDTQFFAGIFQKGGVFDTIPDAIVRERIPQSRLSFQWLAKRRFRIGQTHSELNKGLWGRGKRSFAAALKAIYCFCGAAIHLLCKTTRNRWLLRGIMHLGVCAGCFSVPKRELYAVSNQS